MKKICVVGLGSISKRHIRNIRSLYPDVQIDILRHGKGGAAEASSEFGRELYSPGELSDGYDAVFITNPTTMHVKTLESLLDKSDAFFVEKPLRPLSHDDSCVMNVNGHGGRVEADDANIKADKDIIASLPSDKIFYVACPMRYTRNVQWVKENVDLSSVYSIRAITSSYLPEWRPGTDYTNCYSARRDLGGGVAADLIHEWDYISFLFGHPERILTVERKLSDLDIDVEDIAVYIGEYKDKIAEVHLDYFGRSVRRELELFMRDDTVICDFVLNKITFLKSNMVIDLEEDRDDYQIAELKHFFDIVQGRAENDSPASEAEALLELLEQR